MMSRSCGGCKCESTAAERCARCRYPYIIGYSSPLAGWAGTQQGDHENMA